MAITAFKFQKTIVIEPVEIKTPTYSFKSEQTTLNMDIFSTSIVNPKNPKDIQLPSYGYIIAKRTKNVAKGGFLELIISVFAVVTFNDGTDNLSNLGDINEYFVLAFFTSEKISLKVGEGVSSYSEVIINKPIEIFNDIAIILNNGITQSKYRLDRNISSNIQVNDMTGLVTMPESLNLGEFHIIAPEGEYVSYEMNIPRDEFQLQIENEFTKEVNGKTITGKVTKVILCIQRNLEGKYESNGTTYIPTSYTYQIECNFNGDYSNPLIFSDEDKRINDFDQMPILAFYPDGMVTTFLPNWDMNLIFSERLDAIYNKAPNDGYGFALQTNLEKTGVTVVNPIIISKMAFQTPYRVFSLPPDYLLNVKSYFKKKTKTNPDGTVLEGYVVYIYIVTARNNKGELELIVLPITYYLDKSNDMQDVLLSLSNPDKTPKDISVVAFVQATLSNETGAYVYSDSYIIDIPLKQKIPINHLPLNTLKIEGSNSISEILHNGTLNPIYADGLSFRDFWKKKTDEFILDSISTWDGDIQYKSSKAINLRVRGLDIYSKYKGAKYNTSVIGYAETWENFRVNFESDLTDANWLSYLQKIRGLSGDSRINCTGEIGYFEVSKMEYYWNSVTNRAYPVEVLCRIYIRKPENPIYDLAFGDEPPSSELFISYILREKISNIKTGDSSSDIIDFTLLKISTDDVRAYIYNDSSKEVVCRFALLVEYYTDKVISEIKSGLVLYQRQYSSKYFSPNGEGRLAFGRAYGHDVFPFMEIKGNRVSSLTSGDIYTYSYSGFRNPEIVYGDQIWEDTVLGTTILRGSYIVLVDVLSNNIIKPKITANTEGMTFSMSKDTSLPSGFTLDSSTGIISGNMKSVNQFPLKVIARNQDGSLEYSSPVFYFILANYSTLKVEYPSDKFTFNVNTPFTITPKVTGTGNPITKWEIINWSNVWNKNLGTYELPSSINFDSKTGTFSGQLSTPDILNPVVIASSVSEFVQVNLFIRFVYTVSGFAEELYKNGIRMMGYSDGYTFLHPDVNKFGTLPPMIFGDGSQLKAIFSFKLDANVTSDRLKYNQRSGVIVVLSGNSTELMNRFLLINGEALDKWDVYYDFSLRDGNAIYRFAPLSSAVDLSMNLSVTMR